MYNVDTYKQSLQPSLLKHWGGRLELPEPLGLIQQLGADNDLAAILSDSASFVQE